MVKVGIAICSFNRKDILAKTIDAIKANTSVSYELVVSDDGSTDGTQKMLDDLKVEYITGQNRNIAWNKNRAIYYLKHKKNVDVLVLLEDDTYPLEANWEVNWISGIQRWGHINLAASHWPKNFSYGLGTPENPYRSAHISAQCAGFSKEAIDQVGYFDSRFKSYGMEHIDHSIRLVKAGFGGKYPTEKTHVVLYYLIDSPLFLDCIDENLDKQKNNENVGLFMQLLQEPLCRSPWNSNEEQFIFLSEQEYPTRDQRYRFLSLKNDEDSVLAYDLSGEDFRFVDQNNLKTDIFRAVFFYHDLNGLRAFWVDKKEVKFLVFDGVYPKITDKKSNATLLSVDFDLQKGLFLKSEGFFATCEKTDNGKLRLNRTKGNLWERMYFHCSIFGQIRSDEIPILIDR